MKLEHNFVVKVNIKQWKFYNIPIIRNDSSIPNEYRGLSVKLHKPVLSVSVQIKIHKVKEHWFAWVTFSQ